MHTSFFVTSRLQKVESILRELHDITDGLQEDKPSAGSEGYHKDKSGEAVHSTGKKENKKFANNTTFKSSTSDALLHTDGSKEGVRAKMHKSAFAVQGKDVDDDPRKKWFPVSPLRGWASAAGSLRQAYAHPKSVSKKVVDKVKQTTFAGAEGKSIQAGDIRPTGALHNERPHCGEGSKGQAHPFQAHDPEEHYRLCKGVHGAGGADEYKTSYTGKKHPHAPGWAKRSELGATGISGIDSARHRASTGHKSFMAHGDQDHPRFGKMDFDKSAPARVTRHQAVHEPVTKMIDTAHRTKFRLAR